jgi:hypothetical protein
VRHSGPLSYATEPKRVARVALPIAGIGMSKRGLKRALQFRQCRQGVVEGGGRSSVGTDREETA